MAPRGERRPREGVATAKREKALEGMKPKRVTGRGSLRKRTPSQRTVTRIKALKLGARAFG
jgi:hypothetical protein